MAQKKKYATVSQIIEDMTDRICKEICKHNAAYETACNGVAEKDKYNEDLLNTACSVCPLNLL